MAKSDDYMTELAEWAAKQEPSGRRPRQDSATVAFLGVKADVAQAMEAGYSITTIWKHMRETGRVTINYETFRRYVSRYIRRKASVAQSAPAPAPVPSLSGGRRRRTTVSKPPKGGFDFSASPPNKEELY